MRPWMFAVLPLVLVLATFIGAQPPKKGDEPKPGARGNPDNVPYIGKSDPKGNPVRLARATGHVSNYSEDKVPAYTLPDPLVTPGGKKVTTAETWVKEQRPEILKFYRTEIYGAVPDN